MFKDLLYEFEHHSTGTQTCDTDSVVLDTYRLASGLYIRLNDGGPMDKLFIPKSGEMPESGLLEWFKRADFQSRIINTNKAIDLPQKKVHSNNIYTMFCKYETFLENNILSASLRKSIERYYSKFLVPWDNDTEKILDSAGYEKLTPLQVDVCKNRICSSLDTVAAVLLEQPTKGGCYVKMFINMPDDDYVREGSRYFLPRIFNCNTYNIQYNENVLGLSNSNMGMNLNKPYLEHKTTSFKVPYRVSASDAVTLRKFMIWLGNQKRDSKSIYSGYVPVIKHSPQLLEVTSEITNNQHTHYLQFHPDKMEGFIINDYDFLPCYSDKLDKPFEVQNYLNASKFELGGKKFFLSEVEQAVDFYLFNKQLVFNYAPREIKVSSRLNAKLAKEVMASRDMFFAWFHKGNSAPLMAGLEQATLRIVIARLQDIGQPVYLKSALNMRYSLIDYFELEGKDMANRIKDQYEALKTKVLSKDGNAFCESEIEFYMAAGQILCYLISLSKAQKVTYDTLLRGVLGSATAESIKEQVNHYLLKYSYAIDTKDHQFNRMLTIVNSYDAQDGEKTCIDALLCGFATDSIITDSIIKEKKQGGNRR